jgi:hypothetical protein
MDEMTSAWRKSKHSNPNGACVEVGAAWRKSSYSGSSNCVEVASDTLVLVRDTKQDGQAHRTVLRLTPGDWQAFTERIRALP